MPPRRMRDQTPMALRSQRQPLSLLRFGEDLMFADGFWGRVENSQDMVDLSDRASKTLQASTDIHGFLLREHGLYTWGAGLQEAKRHVEILEFLMEVLVRSRAAGERLIPALIEPGS